MDIKDARLTEKEIRALFHGHHQDGERNVAFLELQDLAEAAMRKALWWVQEWIANENVEFAQVNGRPLNAGEAATFLAYEYSESGIEPWDPGS